METCRIIAYGLESPEIKSVLDGMELSVIWADSGYEAAAEMLAAPTDAILLNVGFLTKRHIGLLNLARKMNIEIIGVSAPSTNIGLDAHELSEVRLVATSDLQGTIERITAAQGKYIPAHADIQSHKESTKESAQNYEERPDTQYQPETKKSEQKTGAHGVLSAEEISALLKDEMK